MSAEIVEFRLRGVADPELRRWSKVARPCTRCGVPVLLSWTEDGVPAMRDRLTGVLRTHRCPPG